MFFQSIINLGVKPDMEFYQKREAKIINLFALITLLALFFGATSTFIISGPFPTFIVSFTVLTSLCILFFNAKKYYDLATYFFVVPISITIFVICEQYVEAVGSYLYYYLFIFCIAVLHNPIRSNHRTVIFFVILLCSFFATKIFHIDAFKLEGVTANDITVLFFYNQLITVFLAIILVFLVIVLINKQNMEALDLLQKEQAAQLKISQSLKEKEVLLLEIQHRVKNNLAIISGLLNLQMEKAPCETSRLLMLESRNRVMSMAMVHNSLYKKDNLLKIDLELYLSELIVELIESFPVGAQKIQFFEELEPVEMDITKAVPIGLIVNEALTNALKHAFTDHGKAPIIKLKMQVTTEEIKICLLDNGKGFSSISNPPDKGLGLNLMESLALQIDAQLELKNKDGACISLIIPQTVKL